MRVRSGTIAVADLLDVRHYAAQAGRSFPNAAAAYAHFVAEGQASGLDPSPYFDAAWYQWQNATDGRCVLAHFLEHAVRRPVDPAPFVDTVGLLRRTPEARDALGLYLMLLEGGVPDMPPRRSEHLARLRAARASFQSRIDLQIVRDAGRQRRNLVWVQCGRAFRLPTWFEAGARRDWDLLLNWYDLRCLDVRFGETVLRQSGTKATGIHTVLRRHPEILARYQSVLFLDDDLVMRHADVDNVFDLANQHGLDLFQPSLSQGSHCSWPHLIHRRGAAVRTMTGVEIMMFGFSWRALAACGPLFADSVSGFGLDVACSQAVRSRGWSCGVIDAVQVDHDSPIDEAGGSYYEFMRAIGINQKLELAETIEASGTFPDFVTLESTTREHRWRPAARARNDFDPPAARAA